MVGRELSEFPGDAIERARLVQRAQRQLGLQVGAQVEQVPAQAVLDACALGNEVAAVVGE
jgi:hypothetical protein